ncbi:hypothetical protein [Escherichia phage PJNS034]
MAATNYAELVEEVKAWLNRDDPDTINRIPTFINFAEKEIYRVLKLPVYESVVQLTIKNGRAEVPFNLVQLIEIYTNDKRVGRHTSHRELIRHQSDDVLHEQFYFSRVGNEYHFFKDMDSAPGDEGKLEVYCHYFCDPEELSYNNQVTPLLTLSPDLLLFTALRHGSVYAEDMEKAAIWEQRADNVMGEVKQQLEDDDMSGSPQVVEKNTQFYSETRSRVYW